MKTVKEILMSELTPLNAHNRDNKCDWCKAKWKTPDWKLDPQPLLFGHPENDCIVWKPDELVQIPDIRYHE